MQFTVLINQVRALEWGLNSQQAMLFAFLFTSPTWAEAVEINGVAYCHVSKNKVIHELPLLTDKPDTVYRLMKQLEGFGLIRFSFLNKKTLVSITEKGALWNSSQSKNPNVGKKSDVDRAGHNNGKKSVVMSEKNPPNVGKKSADTPENFPTNQITNNQITKSQQQRGGGVENFREKILIWSPPDYVFDQLSQHGVPEWFSRLDEVVIEFRNYWTCRPDAQLNLLPNKFLKSVIRCWRKHEAKIACGDGNSNEQQQREARQAVISALENRNNIDWLYER